ncbi:MAG: ribosome maturation factor RimP [Acidobacteriota bacterium]
MGRPDIDAELHQELEAIAESVECEIYHVRFANNRLQIFLDREDGGVTIDHCQSVSRQVSALLDVHDFGAGRYHLEVGSPGLDRELFRRQDYQRFLGHLARVTFTNAEGNKQTLIGRLQDYEAAPADAESALLDAAEDPSEDLTGAIVLQEAEKDTLHRIPHASIRQARLEIEL